MFMGQDTFVLTRTHPGLRTRVSGAASLSVRRHTTPLSGSNEFRASTIRALTFETDACLDGKRRM